VPFACAISFVACPALHFPTSHKQHAFRNKKLLNKKRVFRVSLQLSSEIIFTLRRTERDMVENVYWSSSKVELYLSDFNVT